MNYEQLRAFVSVAKLGSFRAAAQHLNKTQPTLSASVKSLELHFSITLFNRSSYRPTLTTEGERFLVKAKSLLKQANELELLGHELAQGADPELSLTLSPMCYLPPLVSKIEAFGKQFTNLQLKLGSGHLSGILESLLKQQSDLALAPNIGLDARFNFIEVASIRMITVAAPQLLKQHEQVLKQSKLRNKPHILLADSGTGKCSDNINVISGGQRWYVNDYHIKKELLLAGLGWARVPEHIVQQELEQGLLVSLKVEQFAYRSQESIYLIKLRERADKEIVRAFWQQFS
ncbi:LysR family transcriptional regulator [Agarivorans sp. MS3-6]|uniref:LysR family transcriptional regulator n=1 Tax=Agarivorans sp. TSD2052 TaxID=2937286 RepID=UPI00201027A2|nr:LysR family transcriptional regulator [Agarivorans sp. TSD2052]UPW19854.1 LysR family transcriptional regulator [Agarivorans sp. TSD2052]